MVNKSTVNKGECDNVVHAKMCRRVLILGNEENKLRDAELTSSSC